MELIKCNVVLSEIPTGLPSPFSAKPNTLTQVPNLIDPSPIPSIPPTC